MNNESYKRYFLLSFLNLINKSISLNEMIYLSDEKIMNCSVSLILEMRKMKDEGYSQEEILECLNKSSFVSNEINEEEASFLKNDAKKNLKIIYRKEGKNYE